MASYFCACALACRFREMAANERGSALGRWKMNSGEERVVEALVDV